jgi:hypothetical protein
MGAQDNPSLALNKVSDCGQGSSDAAIIGNRPGGFIQGNIKVSPDQDSLATNIYIPDGQLIHF